MTTVSVRAHEISYNLIFLYFLFLPNWKAKFCQGMPSCCFFQGSIPHLEQNKDLLSAGISSYEKTIDWEAAGLGI